MKQGDWLVIKAAHYLKENESINFFFNLKLKKYGRRFYIFNISIFLAEDHSLIARYEKALSKDEKNLPSSLLPWHTNDFITPKSAGSNLTKESSPGRVNIGRKKFSCEIFLRKESGGVLLANLVHPDIPFLFPAFVFRRQPQGLEKDHLKVSTFGDGKIAAPDFREKPNTLFFSPSAARKIFHEAEFLDYWKGLPPLAQDYAAKNGRGILHAHGKNFVTFNDLVRDCREAKVIFTGEIHDSPACHGMQLRMIKALFKTGKIFSLGLEMFYRTEDIQKGLDDFVAGKISENEFRKKIYNPCWSRDWYHLYRDIFLFARKNKIPMVGLNCPKNLMEDFKRDPDDLTPLMRSWFAQKVDYHDREHREITMWNFRAMAEMGMMVNSLYPGQCIWDDTMAESIFHWILKNQNRGMVVLMGELHISYHVTVPGRLMKRLRGEGMNPEFRTIIPHNGNSFGLKYFFEFATHSIADYAYLIMDEPQQQTGPEEDGQSSIDDSWVEAYYMLNKGKVEEAEKALAENETEIGKKMLQRIQILKKAEKLARSGKFSEASNLIRELDEVYKGIKKIYQKKIDQCRKTGNWPAE